MKKILIITLMIFTISLQNKVSHASEYLAYQEIEFDGVGNEFLDDYSDKQYEKYYEYVSKRKFWGWKTFTVIDAVKVSYIKDTRYIITNEGSTPIIQTYYIKTEEDIKKQYSVSGTIELTVKGKLDGFALGLEDQVKSNITAVSSTSVDEKFEVKVQVDPGTVVKVQIKGEGKLSNGVASYYRFFKRSKKGGWEIFVITTEYYSMTKELIDEGQGEYDENQDF